MESLSNCGCSPVSGVQTNSTQTFANGLDDELVLASIFCAAKQGAAARGIFAKVVPTRGRPGNGFGLKTVALYTSQTLRSGSNPTAAVPMGKGECEAVRIGLPQPVQCIEREKPFRCQQIRPTGQHDLADLARPNDIQSRPHPVPE